MARPSRREYLRSIYHRYRRAGRKEKAAILAEFCRVCGYNRKYAIGLLNRPVPGAVRPRRTTRRSPEYSETMVRVLAKVWEASGYLCSQRLKAALGTWLPWIRQRFALSRQLEGQLLAISPRQMDRRLKKHKRSVKRRLYGTTRPGSLLKQMIPIKTDHWDVTAPGYLEIDLVSHSGASAAGEFIYTLDGVDIATGWVEREAVMGKGQRGIVEALSRIEAKLPFPLRGIDSDNGSEFINHHLFQFCSERSAAIQFTRSRAYKKDDNAHVEQKNWTHVRKLLGWERYDTLEALQAINRLYQDLRIFQNLFQPSMKLRTKTRQGSKLLRRYDSPLTPLDRLCQGGSTDPSKTAALQKLLHSTDPFELSRRIDHKLQALYELASRRDRGPRDQPPLKDPGVNRRAPLREPRSGDLTHRSPSPWRNWTFSKKAKRQKQQMQRTLITNASVTFSHDATNSDFG